MRISNPVDGEVNITIDLKKDCDGEYAVIVWAVGKTLHSVTLPFKEVKFLFATTQVREATNPEDP